MATPTFPEAEQAVTAFWKQHRVFERSVSERPIDKQFSFYDGPPFATGLPHYGHIVASTIKDVIPRYATMRGYRVERRWGWDCHGLPVENLIEKDLGLKTKQDIEVLGVAKFNQACRTSVLKYTTEWRQTIERLGRFVDMDNDYRTMDPAYMESVWWVFKQLYDQGLIYEGKKAMHICPRCVTSLSNFEVTLGYKDITDSTAYAKFKIIGQDYALVAWTTTPWTLPGNLLLAVSPQEKYVVVNTADGKIVCAEKLLAQVVPDGQVEKTLLGSELVGLKYEPLFSYFKDTNQAFRVVAADFVTTTEGTGIVHIAPGYGEDDYQLGLQEGVEILQHVNMEGKFIDAVTDFAGIAVKPKDNSSSTDKKIIQWLKDHNQLWREQDYTHSYPHCWRCDTPLLNYATSSWFVRVTQVKDNMMKNNDTITWMPEHVKYGRFGKWLEGAKDWAISRERYWGAPLPIWQADDGEIICIGSSAELEQLSGQTITDLHKEFVDLITFQHNGKLFKRITSVLDCWFESGSMPYAQNHWLGGKTDKELPPGFPADFIAEGLDQTRGWFYTLTVLSTALYNQPAFKNVIVNGLVLAEDGKKMSKRLKNYPEPSVVFDKYGADALRFYLMSSPVVKAEDLRFSEKGVDLVMKRVLLTLWNVTSFYTMFAAGKTIPDKVTATHIMDKWVLAYTQAVIRDVTQAMDNYDLSTVTTRLEQYIQAVSTWYIRRSRARFKDAASQIEALSTLKYVLLTISKLLAPFTPFIAERIYQTLKPEAITTGDSVHLTLWPDIQENFVSDEIVSKMNKTRELVENVLALREKLNIKIRQPLATVTLPSGLDPEYIDVLLEEVNIKHHKYGDVVEIDTTLTPELKDEGMLRELVRSLNALRKTLKFTINDQKKLLYHTTPALSVIFQKYDADLQTSIIVSAIGESDQIQEHILKVNGIELSVTFKD
ncbi:MAG: isoleucine--tRNA ligase [Patescibacteria group bacterium]|jgi:isoleucyl-tRNA synthetase